MSRRKQRDGRFKAQVAFEAIKNQQTISQIASEYDVNPASSLPITTSLLQQQRITVAINLLGNFTIMQIGKH